MLALNHDGKVGMGDGACVCVGRDRNRGPAATKTQARGIDRRLISTCGDEGVSGVRLVGRPKHGCVWMRVLNRIA